MTQLKELSRSGLLNKNALSLFPVQPLFFYSIDVITSAASVLKLWKSILWGTDRCTSYFFH